MKKIFTIIISAVLIAIIGLGAVGYYVENDNSAEGEKIKNEETVEAKEKQEETKLVINVEKLDVNKIEGYTPGENLTVSNSNLPYAIQNKNMEIVSIGQYSGKFVEDGSDNKKDNVLAMVIKNTSEEVISYGEVKIKIAGTSKVIKFIVTNLKPNTSVLVMESTGEVEFNSNDKYVYVSANNKMEQNLLLMEDTVEITTKDKKVTIKNLSEEKINTVYVYYKTISEGNCYLGGITYRVKFENVESGKSITSNTLHFSNINSEIVKVECASE